MRIRTKETKVYLGIRVPPTLMARLTKVQRDNGVTLTAAVEQLLVWALVRHEKEATRRTA